MRNLITAIWHDEGGFIVSAELVLIGTLAVVGVVAGITHVRGAVIDEYQDVGKSLRSLNQSFSYGGFRGCKSFTAGSAYYQEGQEVVDFKEVYECPVVPQLPPPVDCPIERPLHPVPYSENYEGRIYEPGDCPPGVDCPGAFVPPPCAPESPCGTEPCPDATSTYEDDCCGTFPNFYKGYKSAPTFGVGEYQSPPPGSYHPESVYNVRRNFETPDRMIAPQLAPRSSVW